MKKGSTNFLFLGLGALATTIGYFYFTEGNTVAAQSPIEVAQPREYREDEKIIKLAKKDPASFPDIALTPMDYHSIPHAKTLNHELCKSPSLIEENFNLEVYNACNYFSQREGLKMVKSMPENQGMLFVYTKEEPLNFWMKQTYLPLSIAYLDKDFKVVSISKMTPLSLKDISSVYPAQYALELNVDAMDRLNIKVGSVLKFKPSNKVLDFIPPLRTPDTAYEEMLYNKYHKEQKN